MSHLKNPTRARQSRQRAHRWAARRGFTLIEIMIALVLLAILSVLAVPSFNAWIANTRLRAVGSDFADGLRLAQTESLRRNRPMVFVLTKAVNPAPPSSSAPLAYTAENAGTNWAVSVAKPSWDTSPDNGFVRSGSNTELMKNVFITSDATATCFSALGRVVANANTGISGAVCEPMIGTPPLRVYKISMSGADHDLWVEVGLGGQVRLCNPDQTLSSTTPEGCTPTT